MPIQLDPQQLQAVRTESKKVLCLSGAGSGKTRVLTERIAYLLEEKKVSAYEILACCFTRKASGEVRQRIEARLGKKGIPITLGTIHAFALRMLKQFGEMLGFKPQHLTVYSPSESNYLLREVGMDLGIYNGKVWKIGKREIDAMFDHFYQTGEGPQEYDPKEKVFKEFFSRLKENNSMNYGSLLTHLYGLLWLPSFKEYWKYKHILIDEIQDIDKLQWMLLNQMMKIGGESLFVVGDISQSIYSFRGAVPEYLIEHQKEFDIYSLESNYRSCPEIVNAANSLILHNTKRFPMTMAATRTDKGQCGFLKEMDSEVIAKEISTWYDDGETHKDVAILYRNHFLGKRLSEVLTNLNFPHTRIGQTDDLMDRMDFRVFHAFLKLILNKYDNFSFSLIRELLGVSRKQYGEIRLQATKESRSHFQVWWKSLPADASALEFFRKSTTDDSPILLAERIQETWPFDSPEIMEFVEQWMDEQGEGTLEDYLDWLATYDLQDEIKDTDDKLKLMTIHACKGLEFGTVMIIGCNDGILPSKQSIEKDEIEDERRLFYVALTRAKDSVILAVRPELTQAENGKYFENPVSRFLGEI